MLRLTVVAPLAQLQQHTARAVAHPCQYRISLQKGSHVNETPKHTAMAVRDHDQWHRRLPTHAMTLYLIARLYLEGAGSPRI